MENKHILRIYLEPDELKRARDGQFNVMNRIKIAFDSCDYRVEFMRNSVEQREKSANRNGYSLFLMQDPFHDRALNLRLAYYYPFWRIENTAERWAFRVAMKSFDAKIIDINAAVLWSKNWRKWLFGDAAVRSVNEGFVYIPLQGRILEQRSFQTTSPIKMIKAVLEHDKTRRILIGLHPGENLSGTESDVLDTLIANNSRISVQKYGMKEALRTCDYVVSQNSSVALSGFFFHKPAILFAKTDFHHIALNVHEIGKRAAFERINQHHPAYDAFLYWFINMNTFKADEENVEENILNNVQELGWDLRQSTEINP